MTALLARLGFGAGPDGTAATLKGDRVALGTVVAAGAALVGLLGVLVFGGLWLWAVYGPNARAVAVREDALVAARQIAINLNTLDYTAADKGLDSWEQSSTGPLLEEFRKNRQPYVAQLNQVRMSLSGTVVDIALTNLDTDAGTAQALAAVDVKTTVNANGTTSLPVNRPVRIRLDLVRVPDLGWKATAANSVRP
jgi:Mce-associated membrane protein